MILFSHLLKHTHTNTHTHKHIHTHPCFYFFSPAVLGNVIPNVSPWFYFTVNCAGTFSGWVCVFWMRLEECLIKCSSYETHREAQELQHGEQRPCCEEEVLLQSGLCTPTPNEILETQFWVK